MALREAIKKNVRIFKFDDFIKRIRELEDGLSAETAGLCNRKRPKVSAPMAPHKRPRDLNPTALKSPFIKIEQASSSYRPQWKEFNQWPAIYLHKGNKRLFLFSKPNTVTIN